MMPDDVWRSLLLKEPTCAFKLAEKFVSIKLKLELLYTQVLQTSISISGGDNLPAVVRSAIYDGNNFAQCNIAAFMSAQCLTTQLFISEMLQPNHLATSPQTNWLLHNPRHRDTLHPFSSPSHNNYDAKTSLSTPVVGFHSMFNLTTIEV